MGTEKLNINGHSWHSIGPVAVWLAIACILAAGVGYSWSPTPFAQALAALFIACALVHAGVFYGPKQATVLFIICIVITFAMENLGAATGFPFGNYHFVVDAGLPRIGIIPIIVGPLWFGAGYFSWVVASILLDGANRRLGRTFDLIALPVIAAFVMTQWDLVMDRSESTIAGAWIWHDGGADFGVPLSNYLGWLLTSWLFFQTFAFYLCRQLVGVQTGAPAKPKAAGRRHPLLREPRNHSCHPVGDGTIGRGGRCWGQDVASPRCARNNRGDHVVHSVLLSATRSLAFGEGKG